MGSDGYPGFTLTQEFLTRAPWMGLVVGGVCVTPLNVYAEYILGHLFLGGESIALGFEAS